MLRREQQKWWKCTAINPATPENVRQGNNRVLVIKYLKRVIHLFYCAPTGRNKIKDWNCNENILLYKRKTFTTLSILCCWSCWSSSSVEHRVVLGWKISCKISNRPSSLRTPVVIPLNIMFNFIRILRLENICSLPFK